MLVIRKENKKIKEELKMLRDDPQNLLFEKGRKGGLPTHDITV